MSEARLLELDAVTKVYGSEPPVAALRGVGLTIRRGELVAIVGPSGSGKTTLLQIMGTLDRPTAGTVRVDGADVACLDDSELAALRARSIGFVFQQFFLAEHRALDNVADGLLYAGVAATSAGAGRGGARPRSGSRDRESFRPSKLSGGERQRVAIARALVGEPAIVLADEPTGNLDSASGAAILELLQRAQRRRRDDRRDHPRPRPRRPAAAPGRDARRPRRARCDSAGGRMNVASPAARLRARDLARVASVGLRTRRLRAALSALGIAIGVASIVAVLGLSSSSQAGLLAEIDRLGTNLLTAKKGQSLTGEEAQLPLTAVPMVDRVGAVEHVADTGAVDGADAYRNPFIPVAATNGLAVQAASLNLPGVIGDRRRPG